jgi:hypothetical protein
MQLHEALTMISGMNESELHDLNRAVCMQIKDYQNRDAREKRSAFKVGDKVSWTGRNGYTEGTIRRVKRKKAIVEVLNVGKYGSSWDVPLNMLNVVNS